MRIQVILLATDDNFNLKKEESEFRRTFEILDFALGENAFKRYDSVKTKFGGRFLISAYEAIAYGLGKNINQYEGDILDDNLKLSMESKVKEIWSNADFQNRSGSGIPVTLRIPTIIPIGEQIFSK